MANAIDQRELKGFKYFKKLRPLFRRLHAVGCERDTAGNRQLHMDQYCAMVLLAMFNVALDSLRSMQRAGELPKVQQKLGCPRFSLGSFSEAPDVFEPQLLEGIIAELAGQLHPVGRDPRLAELRHVITLVDGTLLKALPRIAEAMWLTTRTGTVHHAWRLHTQFELDRYVPTRMDLTNGRNSGDSDEKTVLRSHLQQDRCYVMDRRYSQFLLFNDIHAVHSSYVCRVRDNSAFAVREERTLSEQAAEAGVVRDVNVEMGSSRSRPDHPLRLVIVRTTPHQKRSNRKGNTGAGPSDGLLRIATDLLGVPAEIIALIYHYRYSIELFFRFFKHLLGCRHLFSDDPRGIAIQTYCAIIACLLINCYTGKKPNKGMLQMIQFYLSGWASEADLLTYLNKPDNTGVKLRAKEALWKKLGY